MAVHTLKTVQPYFEEVWKGNKKFEIRINDRDFKMNEIVFLREYDPVLDKYSGRQTMIVITYIMSEYIALDSKYIIFSFSKIENQIYKVNN